jgi:hypothetical protein
MFHQKVKRLFHFAPCFIRPHFPLNDEKIVFGHFSASKLTRFTPKNSETPALKISGVFAIPNQNFTFRMKCMKLYEILRESKHFLALNMFLTDKKS